MKPSRPATPRTLRCYQRLGWPLVIRGELREHWGEPCYLCSLSVRDVAGGAGYLPRTWAKLQIDRLLAEDAAKYREQVIGLQRRTVVRLGEQLPGLVEVEGVGRESLLKRGFGGY